jgi:hypothetical protein
MNKLENKAQGDAAELLKYGVVVIILIAIAIEVGKVVL